MAEDYQWQDVTLLTLPDDTESFAIDIDLSRAHFVHDGPPLPSTYIPRFVIGSCEVWIAPAELERLRAGFARLRWRQRRTLLLWLFLRWYRRIVLSN